MELKPDQILIWAGMIMQNFMVRLTGRSLSVCANRLRHAPVEYRMAKPPSVLGLAIACIVFVGILMCTVNAQENAARLDSINGLLDPAKKDTIQLQFLTHACESWYTSNNAFPYLERLGELSAELAQSDVPQIKKRAIRARGAFHFFTGYHAKFARNIPLALRSFNEALRDFEQVQGLHAVGETHDALGVLY